MASAVVPNIGNSKSLEETDIKQRVTRIQKEQEKYQKAKEEFEQSKLAGTNKFWTPQYVQEREAKREKQNQLYQNALPKSVKLWKEAKSFEDVLQLGSLVAKGEIASPWYLSLTTVDSSNEDYNKYTELMSEINKMGILTTDSQSGKATEEDGSSQRAYLDGIGYTEVVEQLCDLLNRVPGIVAYYYPVNTEWPTETIKDGGFTVTYDMKDAFSGAGRVNMSIFDISDYNKALANRLFQLPISAITIVDTINGRNILLQEVLASLLYIKGKY